MGGRAVVGSPKQLPRRRAQTCAANCPLPSMGATGTKLDRKPAVAAQALASVRQLLLELGSSRGTEELVARGTKAHLERELGLGSLERVELMLRMGDACGVRLPDRVVAEADTVQDLVDAILRVEAADGENGAGAQGVHGAAAVVAAANSSAPAVRPDIDEQIRKAETLSEIFRLRGRGEPGRSHIQIYEEDEQLRTITFGELYERASVVAADLRRRGLEPGQTEAIMLPTCAEFRCRFIRRSERTASRNTRRGNRIFCATRKRNFW